LLSYITSTRRHAEVPMATDAIRFFHDHLSKITAPKETTIDLFIHSNGGDGTVPWRLVNLIREYCSNFNVLVPHNAYSAATLTALGADSIIMHPMGVLGPTDPMVGNQFNPKDPETKKIVGINVEDVSAYIELLKDDVGIRHEDELVIAFNHLASQIHPLALGNVKRSRSQSKQMATKLLQLHMDPKVECHKIEEIVEKLTSKSYYHGHPINRKEAKEELGLNIQPPNQKVENLMWQLYIEYEKEMRLNESFDFIQDFIKANPDVRPNAFKVMFLPKMKGVYIESKYYANVRIAENQVIGTRTREGMYEGHLATIRDYWDIEQ